MVGKFLLILALLFSTGKFCQATLSTPTSSITQPISVDANPVISIDVTTSIQATDAKVSFGGVLFATVEIRPSSITVTDAASTTYDSRVTVTHEVLTANTNVRVKVTFTSIQRADDNLVIKFEDTADVDEKTFTLDVEYCSNTFFEPAATSLNPSNNCGSGCTEQFTCGDTYKPLNFTRNCQTTASWDDSTHPCVPACDNEFFGNASAIDPSIVGGGETKEFNCTCGDNFSKTCGSDGRWTNETNPCSPVVGNVDNIHRRCNATRTSDELLCGGATHQFTSGEITLEFECDLNGNWVNASCKGFNYEAAAGSVGGIYGALLIVAIVLVCVNQCQLPTVAAIVLYIVALVLVVVGFAMLLADDVNPVAIAGVVLGTIGLLVKIAGIVVHIAGPPPPPDILTTPKSSITPPFPVGTSPTISTIAKANIQPRDVKISLGGKLFKTVRISSSSPTEYYGGLPEYDSRVTVRADGKNTNVPLNVTIKSIQKADHGLAIKFEADGDAKTFSLTVGNKPDPPNPRDNMNGGRSDV